MDGFDTSTMTYMAPNLGLTNVVTSDAFNKSMYPTDLQDHLSTFDVNTWAGSEDLTFPSLQPQMSPRLKRFSSGAYDEPFSDVVSAFDNPINHEVPEGETTTIDRDNKLLSFSQPTLDHVLLDYTFRQTTISLAAQLHGMFFLAESPWAAAGDSAVPHTELTCYRRNLFQITGNVTLPRNLHFILTEQGKQIPIISQELVISASESTEGNAVKIISVPWKTPISSSVPAPSVDDKAEKEPPSIPLDLMNVQDLGSDFTNVPFQWRRLQFRIATANNGRRKELQQHFVVRLSVMATLATGGKVPICEVQSAAIIVRGRSPRNFQARKDMPLNGAGSHARKSTNAPPQVSRTSTGDTKPKQQTEANTSAPVPAPVKIEAVPPPPPMSVHSFFDPADLPLTSNYFGDFLNAEAAQLASRAALGPMAPLVADSPPFNPVHAYPASSPDINRRKRPAPTSAPINLSLIEDDTAKPTQQPDSRPDSAGPPTKKVRMPPRPPSFSLNTASSPSDETADLLYEYFPLGLDDWMPPVDAVYRPHVVHHIVTGSELKGAPRLRSKRYFSEDVGYV